VGSGSQKNPRAWTNSDQTIQIFWFIRNGQSLWSFSLNGTREVKHASSHCGKATEKTSSPNVSNGARPRGDKNTRSETSLGKLRPVTFIFLREKNIGENSLPGLFVHLGQQRNFRLWLIGGDPERVNLCQPDHADRQVGQAGQKINRSCRVIVRSRVSVRYFYECAGMLLWSVFSQTTV